MKRFSKVVLSVLLVTLWSSALSAKSCESSFMHDPCSVDGYSIVDTERFVKGKHNWMHDIHHFGEQTNDRVRRKKRTKRKILYTKKRYRYVRKCRLVKVPE